MFFSLLGRMLSVVSINLSSEFCGQVCRENNIKFRPFWLTSHYTSVGNTHKCCSYLQTFIGGELPQCRLQLFRHCLTHSYFLVLSAVFQHLVKWCSWPEVHSCCLVWRPWGRPFDLLFNYALVRFIVVLFFGKYEYWRLEYLLCMEIPVYDEVFINHSLSLPNEVKRTVHT